MRVGLAEIQESYRPSHARTDPPAQRSLPPGRSNLCRTTDPRRGATASVNVKKPSNCRLRHIVKEIQPVEIQRQAKLVMNFRLDGRLRRGDHHIGADLYVQKTL